MKRIRYKRVYFYRLGVGKEVHTQLILKIAFPAYACKSVHPHLSHVPSYVLQSCYAIE